MCVGFVGGNMAPSTPLIWTKHLWVAIPILAAALLLLSLGPPTPYNIYYNFNGTTSLLRRRSGDHTGADHGFTLVHPIENESEIQQNLTKKNSPSLVSHGEEEDVLHQNVTTTNTSKRRTNLEKVEADLAEARAAILEAIKGKSNLREDPDFIPTGPIYWNPIVFQRSYLEMEKRLKIYIYEEGDPPVFHFGPCKHTYAIEGIFVSDMEVSWFRTYDPNEAHLFFLPMSITMITQVIYIPESHDWTLMKNTALDYVNTIALKYPFWNRTQGADHFMLACHDWGPEISFAVPNLYNNSIRALCNANTSEQFNPARDVSIPEIHLPRGTTQGMIGGPPPSQRSILVFYAGGIHGPIRPILLEHWENRSDPEVRIHQYLPKNQSYYGLMRKSRFCLCPSGYEVASPRMVEGLYLGCVPVLIKEGYVIPFSDVLNWDEFAVVLSVADIPNLKKILKAIPLRRYLSMQWHGGEVRRHFLVESPPRRYDVFHMILHSIWLRRLNVQLHEFVEAPEQG